MSNFWFQNLKNEIISRLLDKNKYLLFHFKLLIGYILGLTSVKIINLTFLILFALRSLLLIRFDLS